MTHIPKDQCIHRRLYRIRARNFSFGVFNEETCGFLGIRTKFGNRYVFEEYHWDHTSYPTVRPLKDLGIDLPDDIPCLEYLPGTWSRREGQGHREIGFDTPVAEGGRGWFFKDTGEDANPEGGSFKDNTLLFEWLEQQLLARPSTSRGLGYAR